MSDKIKHADLKILFKDSWRLVWQNPIIWLFGFFAAFFSNNEIISLFKNYKKITDWMDQLVVLKSFRVSLKDVFQNPAFSDIFNLKENHYFLLAVIIALLFLFLSFLSQIAIILSVKKYANKEEKPFSRSWKRGKVFLWPVIGVYALVFLINYGFLALLGSSFFYNSLPIIVLVIIFLLLGILLSFLLRFSIFFIVLQKEKFFKSIKNGFLFFIKNFSATIRTSVYICVIAFLAGFVIFLISIGTAFPFIIIVDLFLRLNLMVGFWFIFIFWSILILAFLLAVGSIFYAWQTFVWTSLFLKLSPSFKVSWRVGPSIKSLFLKLSSFKEEKKCG